MESHAAAAGNASASDSDEETEEAVPRNEANGHGAQHEKAAADRPGAGKKKGKRKRDVERKRPGKRQRAELKQQRGDAGLPQRKAKRATEPGGVEKKRNKKIKPAENPTIGQQTLTKVPAEKSRRQRS